jgi:N-methylhydantoinase A
VIAPQAPGALSAVGVMVADVIKDQSRTVMFTKGARQIARLKKVFAEMERDATALLRSEGFARAQQRHERSLAMRYRGQSFELEVRDTSGDIAGSFHRAHRERYGYAQENREIVIVRARVRSFGLVPKMPVTLVAAGHGVAKPQDHTTAYFGGRRLSVGVYQRDELHGGVKLKTPCIVTEYSATTLIPGDARARVDQFGNILIKL